MPNLPQDTIRELRQTLPLLKRLAEEFGQALTIHPDGIVRLKRASDRVRALTSTDQFEAWVGGQITYEPSEEIEDVVVELVNDETSLAMLKSTDTIEINQHLHRYAHSLHLYVQGIVQSEQLDETLNRLTQENASLREQLAELRQREVTYLSMIREAQISTTYSPPPDSDKILLASLERQRAIIIKNLCRAQEQKAQYGIDPPLHILNTVDQLQKDLEPIDNTIAYLKANITEMN